MIRKTSFDEDQINNLLIKAEDIKEHAHLDEADTKFIISHINIVQAQWHNPTYNMWISRLKEFTENYT